MSAIKGLGYVGCSVSSLAAWDALLATVFSLERKAAAHGETLSFSPDGAQSQLTLHKANHDALAYIGWEVATAEDLQEIETRLTGRGIAFVDGDQALREERGVTNLIVLVGPDGVRNELFYGPLADRQPSNLGNQRVLQRRARGATLGHIVLACGNRSASVQWYHEILGFELTDQIFWDGVEATFMRCNPQHHSLALTNPVGDMMGGNLGHFMFATESIDDVGRAYDAVRKNGIPVAFTLGRHSNDQSFSFYVYTPSGWLMEYGCGGRVIEDPAWEPRFYTAPSLWGHEGLPPPGGDPLKQRY